MVFMRKSAPAGDGVYAFKTPQNHRILWKSTDEAQSGPRSRERQATCGTGNTRPACTASGTSSSQDSRSIPALRPFREPDSAEYRDSQPHKERSIRCNQRCAQLSVVPSGRDRGHEIHADRKQPPHEEARCQREVRRSRPDKGRGHQQRYWTSAGQSERGRQHAQRHRRPEEQDRLPEIHQIKPALLAAQALEQTVEEQRAEHAHHDQDEGEPPLRTHAPDPALQPRVCRVLRLFHPAARVAEAEAFLARRITCSRMT